MRKLIGLLILPLFLTSCGESFLEVAGRHQAELDALGADMKQLSELVAAHPGEKVPETPLDPLPVYKEDGAAGSNASIVIWERLADPLKEYKTDELMDLYLSNGLENCFTWSTWEGKAFDNFETDLGNATSVRYLVTYKTLEYHPPVVDANLNYTIGGARLGVYVFDREKTEIVCAFPLAATSSETVNYQYQQSGGDQAQSAQRWARSSLWENLRKSILPALSEKTGGKFEM